MKRYIITIKEFEGIQIKRFDGFFKTPFKTVERFTEDEDGWCWSSRTASHLKLLLRQMERMEKADRVDDRSDRFHEVWIIDVIDGIPVGDHWGHSKRNESFLPPMEAIRAIDLGPGPEEII